MEGQVGEEAAPLADVIGVSDGRSTPYESQSEVWLSKLVLRDG